MYSVPTLLTYARIALIPVFVLVFYLPVEWSNEVATLIFGLAGITDWLDGYLARKLNQMSRFGAFLDPVADKLMVAAALVLLVQQDPTLWMAAAAVVIIGREITISALREWMAEIGKRTYVAVSRIGKYKTSVQIVALFMLIYRDSIFGIPVYTIGLGLLYVAVVLTLWSMFVYLRAAWPVIAAERE